MTDANVDPNNPGAGNPDPNNTNPQGGTDPTKTGNPGGADFDPSKLADDAFGKVFDDPRLFNHPRFKSLNDRAKKADDYESKEAEAEKKRLEAEGKWKELADMKEKEATEAKTQLQAERVNNRLISEASKAGVADPADVLALVDRSLVKVNSDGSIEGAAEAVKTLVEAKPYLKSGSSSTTAVGTGSNPGGSNDQPPLKFKASQLKDPEFYKKFSKEIDKAMTIPGAIEDDLPS